MYHISTSATFDLKDIDPLKGECLICCQETLIQPQWTGYRCLSCGSTWDSPWMGHIVKRRRELLKLTRPEMSKLTGYSKNTIKTYEWTKCSMKYFKLTTEIMREKRPQKKEECNGDT